MKTYSCEFRGYYPVGAVALVIAESKLHAKVILENKLESIGLPQEISITEFKEIYSTNSDVIILLDGNY